MMRTIERATWRSQPWKNGRGTTLEIVRWPDRDDYDVRVSLAEVMSSGPFSTFPGYRRHTFLVGPAPIRLGDIRLVMPGDHVELPGECEIDASLSEPTQLLNVLVRSALAITVGHGPTAHRVRFSFDVSTKIAQEHYVPDAVASRSSVWIA
jgi:environmental stress-induced protein Ves